MATRGMTAIVTDIFLLNMNLYGRTVLSAVMM